MRKFTLLVLTAIFILVGGTFFNASAQWTSRADNSGITKHKAVARVAFPKEFKLFNLSVESLRQELFTIVGNAPLRTSTVISLPNAAGFMEQFEVFEASNFDPALQARFPQIRAFSGKGITDRAAMLKLSISPQGIQTMVFRVDGPNEYIEPYSQDNTVYAVFKSQRDKGALPWLCSTADQQLATDLNQRVLSVESNTGQLKTMRLAQSCNGEYSNFFGAFNNTQVALVLAAFNNTLTRCNGCYEKDLALHLNLIATTDQVIFYDPATDPYTTLNNWNGQLQATLTSIIGEANYDIGHMFGASGGGGNAGCIGCVCVDGIKGSGITSPADNIPMGDNFDIDYVAHEVGHQLGGNHTFSFTTQAGLQPVEVGSGITIMGYAGITSQDVAPHSIDIFHERSIEQIQVNLATKTCPITTVITPNNATPVVAPVPNYTIPMTTPFALTGAATDANAGDVLSYCWEQNDNGNGTVIGNNSVAFPTKAVGPNWLSFPATLSPTRLFPRLATILAGLSVTQELPGGDPVADIEALSSVARTLNFRLTVRDNCLYVPVSPGPAKVGQTAFTDMTVTVDASTGPFLITSQNSAISYPAGSSQTVTWSVNGTTGAPINCALVKISFSSDGGNTFPTVLSASTPNDGSETFTVPSSPTTTGRIKVEAIGNIFFDINNASITVAAPLNGFSFNSPAAVSQACPASNVMTSGNLTATYVGTFNGPIALTGTVSPAGPAVSFSNPLLTTVTPSSTVSLTGMAALPPGTWTVTVTGTPTPPVAGVPAQTRDIQFIITTGAGPTISVQPANQTVCAGTNATFSVTASGTPTYQWQISTAAVPAFTNISGATASSYTQTGTTTAMSGNQYRVIVTGQCGVTTSNPATLTVNAPPAITSHPANLSLCSGSSASFSVTATGATGYQWEYSTDGGGTYNNVPAAAPYSGTTTATMNISATTVAMNNYRFRVVVTGACPPSVTSTAAILSVSSSVTITTNPSNQTVCEATSVSFTVGAGGSGLSYQWQVSTDGGGTFNNVPAAAPYSGSTTPTLTINPVPPTFNGYRYRAVVSSGVCTPGTSTAATLTVNTFPVIGTQPQNVTICEGAGGTFTVVATTGVGTLSYQWQLSTDGGTTYSNIAGATTSSFAQTNIPLGQNGYRFRVIVTAGCGSVTSAAALMTVNAYPVVTFNPITSICVSDPAITLSASPSGGAFAGPGVSGSSFTPSIAGVGVKTVTYTVSNAGCATVTTRTILVNECAERHLTLEQFPAVVVYPIPSAGDFNIRLQTDLYTKLNIKLYNSMGQLVKTEVVSGLSFGSVIPVHTFNLPNGTYHLFLSNDERGAVSSKGQKIMIQKL